ncbi:MAG: aspartate aminotransferase [Paracoccaceae bacterium]
MNAPGQYMVPEIWMQEVFASKAAQEGRVVRRKIADIDRVVGRRKFNAEIRRRGYHAMENAGQYVIFCNNEPVRIIVPGARQNSSKSFEKIFRKIFWPFRPIRDPGRAG